MTRISDAKKLSPKKHYLLQKEITYMDYMISIEEVRMDPNKVDSAAKELNNLKKKWHDV